MNTRVGSSFQNPTIPNSLAAPRRPYHLYSPPSFSHKPPIPCDIKLRVTLESQRGCHRCSGGRLHLAAFSEQHTPVICNLRKSSVTPTTPTHPIPKCSWLLWRCLGEKPPLRDPRLLSVRHQRQPLEHRAAGAGRWDVADGSHHLGWLIN